MGAFFKGLFILIGVGILIAVCYALPCLSVVGIAYVICFIRDHFWYIPAGIVGLCFVAAFVGFCYHLGKAFSS